LDYNLFFSFCTVFLGEIIMEQQQFSLPDFLPPLLEQQYGGEWTARIMAGYQCSRAVTLRVNPLRGEREQVLAELRTAGLAPEPVTWYPDAFLLPHAKEAEVEGLPLYQQGQVYLQSLSSMLPPLVLDPQPGQDILDMAAAPGGKTTQLAALAGNRCRITACERNPIRAERLKYNLTRQGASCAYVMVTDARDLDDGFSFDRILLDAPCSGSGTLSAQTGAGGFSRTLVEKSVERQRGLLRKALGLLKVGQELVYSTCSILEEENEGALRAVLGAHVELVPIQGDWLEALPLLPTSLPGTVCVCPDERFEGFFVAKLRKTGPVSFPKEKRQKSGARRNRRGR
jgi:16S rRNA C967 or C1407 C5-methylase (RsmB/RsmF family)